MRVRRGRAAWTGGTTRMVVGLELVAVAALSVSDVRLVLHRYHPMPLGVCNEAFLAFASSCCSCKLHGMLKLCAACW